MRRTPIHVCFAIGYAATSLPVLRTYNPAVDGPDRRSAVMRDDEAWLD